MGATPSDHPDRRYLLGAFGGDLSRSTHRSSNGSAETPARAERESAYAPAERENQFDEDSRPIIVLCHARTASTLLAYLLNSNPTLYCPAETNFGQTLLGMARWAAEIARDPEESPGTELFREAQVAIVRDFVNALYSERLQAEGARRWCDKSLGTHAATELVDRILPDAQFICLYRNFSDFAASALEACPFGLRNYGFDPYAQETPSNAIFSLARYWVDHVRAITAFQDAHPQSAIAVTYEDLVQDFDATVSELGAFLDAPWDEDSLCSERIFRQRYSTGFQDHKITSTSQVRAESVHRQWMLPVEMIPPPLIEAINELHTRLGYPAIDKPLAATGERHPHIDPQRLAALDQVVAAITEGLGRIKEVLADARPIVIRLDFLDAGISHALMPLQAEVRRGAPTAWDVCISSTIEALRDVTNGEANAASLMTSGQLKVELANPDPPELEVLAAMHHFWRAITDPQYPPVPIGSVRENGVVA